MNQPRSRDFSETVRGLMRSFRQRRPLRGGSLITTVFGDSLAARHCEVSLSGLIGLLSPFGLTERRQRGLRALTIAESAPVALRVLRYLRGRCASLGAPSWGATLGRYHRGTAGPLQGCVADGLARIEVARARVR